MKTKTVFAVQWKCSGRWMNGADWEKLSLAKAQAKHFSTSRIVEVKRTTTERVVFTSGKGSK